MKRNSERKNSILDETSKFPEIESAAKLTMLGAAMNKKNTGLCITGKLLVRDNL